MIFFISFIIFFFSALSWKFFASIGVGFLIIAPYLWNSLKHYQKQRILTLFNPENDPLGSGYHIIQSQIAIGSGGTFGKGWMKGTQSHLDFLPEKHTDFIFSMLGEEFGFLGTISVIGLIVLITYLTYQVVNNSKIDMFQRILGFGIISNFFFDFDMDSGGPIVTLLLSVFLTALCESIFSTSLGYNQFPLSSFYYS